MIALIILLCIVVMLVRWSYKKSAYAIDKGKVYNKPHVNTAVVISANPAYETIKLSNNKKYHDDVMMDSNPAYELPKKTESKDVFIRSNPSNVVSIAQGNSTEDQYGKVELNKITQYPLPFHTELTMEVNPSYGISRREGTDNDL